LSYINALKERKIHSLVAELAASTADYRLCAKGGHEAFLHLDGLDIGCLTTLCIATVYSNLVSMERGHLTNDRL